MAHRRELTNAYCLSGLRPGVCEEDEATPMSRGLFSSGDRSFCVSRNDEAEGTEVILWDGELTSFCIEKRCKWLPSSSLPLFCSRT